MRVLITGATGFIGSHLLEVFTDHGWDVRAFVRSDRPNGVIDGLGLERALGDVRDKESLKSALKGCDAVVHAAALVGEWGAPKDFYDINV
ncbi:MAG TPA: NAD-dependent epimerase/dehydratase family protein, partial [bacterium]|nr:NAD-dependent epimerase/dehydratase family protein [bacterium]